MSRIRIPASWINEANLNTVDSLNFENAQIDSRVKGTEHIEKLIAHKLTVITDLSSKSSWIYIAIGLIVATVIEALMTDYMQDSKISHL